jgi:hypothetical protein
MKEQQWKQLREEKLNNLSRRFSNTMVTLALMCKDGKGVRQAIENITYFVEDYAVFLDENIVEEEINEPKSERHGGRDGVCNGGCGGGEASGEPERTEGGSSTSKGDEGKEAEGHQECNGSA